MSKKRFELGKTPQVTVTFCHGSLAVKSWQEAAVVLSGDNYKTSEAEQALTVESHGNLTLLVPYEASLNLQSIHGNLAIKSVDGKITLGEVMGPAALKNVGDLEVGVAHSDLALRNINGATTIQHVYHDLSLRNTGNVLVDTVHGDFSARYVNGSMTINEVMGDVNVRTVNGDLTIQNGRRDANLRNLGGRAELPSISGDIRLAGSLTSGKHTLKAAGDIIVRWPVGAPLNLTAIAPEISNRLTFDKVVEEENSLTGQAGDGDTTLILEAKGRIILKPLHPGETDWDSFAEKGLEFDFDFDNMEGLAEQISAQINDRMAELSARLEGKFGADLASKIEMKAQQTAKRAEEAAARAMKRAEKAMRRTRWQREQPAWSPHPPPSAPTAGKGRRATEEEQLKILRMVEKGVITPEEANTLLEALES